MYNSDNEICAADREYNIYSDINKRTDGQIYLGIVGPVRTGKSTLIKRIMDLLVIPNIDNEHARARAVDELPLSGSGSTIMTTEPKFIPSDSAYECVTGGVNLKLKMIDCVGYMVEGALGLYENDRERMVKTPWENGEIPFTAAAELGTRKVIREHSTIGIVVTCDGSFTDIDRKAYEEPEQKTINELKEIGKPFIVILNSTRPYSKECVSMAEKLSEKYGVSVMPLNCDQLKKEDVNLILKNALMEFPVSEIVFNVPKWLDMLEVNHWLKSNILKTAGKILDRITYMKDIENVFKDCLTMTENDSNVIEDISISDIDMSEGKINLKVSVLSQVYYNILSELTGMKIENEYGLITMIKELSGKKCEFDKVKDALADVGLNGYGVVTPVHEEITLDEPAVIKNGNKYGVKIKATVPSINMLKTNITVEIAPIVGSRNQADDLIEYIKDNSRDNPQGIWETNIFGKTIGQIVDDGIYEKTHNMTAESVAKIGETLEKVMNENSGLVCLIV